MSNAVELKEHLNGAHAEFCASIAELCEKIQDGANFTPDEIVKAIGNETAKCLSDYKGVIAEVIDAL